jgi:Fe-S cluster biogenesis protein NfuA
MPADIPVEQLEAALARVRPLILGHGGDIEIAGISCDGVISVRLVGACKACPNMAMTYVGPIRSYLMQVDGVTEVICEQVNAGPRALGRMARLLGARPFEAIATGCHGA